MTQISNFTRFTRNHAPESCDHAISRKFHAESSFHFFGKNHKITHIWPSLQHTKRWSTLHSTLRFENGLHSVNIEFYFAYGLSTCRQRQCPHTMSSAGSLVSHMKSAKSHQISSVCPNSELCQPALETKTSDMLCLCTVTSLPAGPWHAQIHFCQVWQK